MPVRFKGLSEYDRNFKWKTSELPEYGRLSPEQNQTWAGLRSDQLGITKEPSFISKRRVPYYNPQISESFEWKGDRDPEKNLDAPSDVNVPERVNLHRKHFKDMSNQEKVETPLAPRVPVKKLRSRSADSRMQYVRENKADDKNKSLRVQYVREKEEETENKSHNAQYVRENNADAENNSQRNHKEKKTDSENESQRVQYVREKEADTENKLHNVQCVRENKADAESRSQTQAPVKQTEGSAPSKICPEKESERFHRALQRKAGLTIVPVNNPIRASEYNRQFVWKNPMENSPMLAAEQVIYNKSNAIPPFKTDVIPRATEYNSQFKGSPQAKGPKLRRDWEEKEGRLYESEDIAPEKKNKRDERKPKDSSAKEKQSERGQKQANQKKKLKQQYLQKLHLPYRGYRKANTEYTANFVSPEEYRYRDGAWVRVKQQVPDQVKELRAQAEAYRHRVLGTHFSRDHLNQILSNNNRLWDTASSCSTEESLSSNIKALDLAGVHRPLSSVQKPSKSSLPPPSEKRGSVEKELKQKDTGEMGISDASTIPVRRRLVWEENGSGGQIEPILEEDEEEDDNDNEEHNIEPVQRLEDNYKDVRRDERKRGENALFLDNLETMSAPSSVSEGEGGRLPTPKLKTLGVAQRTHHDLTTPAIGGAVLVSPAKLKSPSPERKTKTSPERRYSPHKRVSREASKRKLGKEEDILMQSPHAAGMRTVDPLPLRDDLWPSVHPSDKIASPVKTHQEHWNTSPLQKSPVISTSPYWSQSCRIHGALRDPEFQHNGNIVNYNQFKLPLYGTTSTDEDDDRLSQISARSAASSSLASLVLDRAQKRKENFWGKR